MIREYRKSDYEELVSLWQICFKDDRDFIESFFASFEKSMKVFVVEENERVLSAVYLLPAAVVVKEEISAWYLYAVSTLPSFRKRGYAGSIIEHIKKLDDGKKLLFLTPSNEQNRRFYKSLSFEDKFYNYEFEYHFKQAEFDLSLEKYDADISKIRNELLENRFVKWDENHISFSFDNNLYLIKQGENIWGYLHFENDGGEIVVDEIVAHKKYINSALSSFCETVNKKIIKVRSNQGDEYCKKVKGMIYCKFDSISKIMSKNDCYLGINLE